MHDVRVLLFAKHPSPGAVKTRFSPPLSPQCAADLHAASLRAVIELVHAVPGLDLHLCCSPDGRCEDLAAFTGLSPDRVHPQGDGDLGARLRRAARQAFAEGARAVILLGADSPTLPGAHLEAARDALAVHDVVITPCDDGGYSLLGLSADCPGLFEGISWSTDQVCRETLVRAADNGLGVQQLETWYDLDRFEDLPRAARDLAVAAQDRPRAGELLALIRSLIGAHRGGHSGGPAPAAGPIDPC